MKFVDRSLSFVRTSHRDEGVALAGVVGISHRATVTKLLFHLIPADTFPHPVDKQLAPLSHLG